MALASTLSQAPLRTEREIFKAVKVPIAVGTPTAVDPMGKWVDGCASNWVWCRVAE